MKATQTIAILAIGCSIFGSSITWLACEMTGYIRPGEFPMCAKVFSTRQVYTEDIIDSLREKLGRNF